MDNPWLTVKNGIILKGWYGSVEIATVHQLKF